jgi:hypothetical protein
MIFNGGVPITPVRILTFPTLMSTPATGENMIGTGSERDETIGLHTKSEVERED